MNIVADILSWQGMPKSLTTTSIRIRNILESIKVAYAMDLTTKQLL